VYQCHEVASSKALVIWVMQTQGNYAVMILLSVVALVSGLAATFVTAAGQEDELTYDVLGAAVFALVFIAFWWRFAGGKHWHSVKHASSRESVEDLKMKALLRLKEMNAYYMSIKPEGVKAEGPTIADEQLVS
jgi:membrane protein implicated in regulation of membrane protease activity